MKTYRLITAMVLVVGLIGVFPAFSAENTTGKQGAPVTEKKESKDQKTAPAPGSTTIQAPAASLQSLPLAIQKLYLKDGTVRVVIKKTGSGRLSDEDYATTKLKVETSTLTKPLEWTLQQVDPRKRLTRLRGEKDFDTGLEVTDRTRVKATLYRGLWKTAKQETLYPRLAKVPVKTQMSAGEYKKGKGQHVSPEVHSHTVPAGFQAIRIRTDQLTLTGTGALPTFSDFPPVHISTNTLTLTGTGALPTFSDFPPVHINTDTLTLTGTGVIE